MLRTGVVGAFLALKAFCPLPAATSSAATGVLQGRADILATHQTGSVPDLVDLEAWRRYCTVLQVFKLYGESIMSVCFETGHALEQMD